MSTWTTIPFSVGVCLFQCWSPFSERCNHSAVQGRRPKQRCKAMLSNWCWTPFSFHWKRYIGIDSAMRSSFYRPGVAKQLHSSEVWHRTAKLNFLNFKASDLNVLSLGVRSLADITPEIHEDQESNLRSNTPIFVLNTLPKIYVIDYLKSVPLKESFEWQTDANRRHK